MSPRPDKRRALLDGAHRMFARDGYARAGIDGLAAEAGVSTRTIYNHFGDKAGLFRATILDSAERVADHEIALADRLLGRIADLEADLVEFGVRWATPDPLTETHFALVRQIRADRDHIDAATVEAWQTAGPRRVRDALAEHLVRMADDGLLVVADPRLAAVQLTQLTAGTAAVLAAEDEREAVVRSGVRVFLAAYRR